jgi:copper resistance protein B
MDDGPATRAANEPRLLLAAAPAVGLATPAFAQHAGHGAPPAAKAAAPAQATGDPSCPPEHAAMGHCTPETAPVSSTGPMPTPPSVADRTRDIRRARLPPHSGGVGPGPPTRFQRPFLSA